MNVTFHIGLYNVVYPNIGISLGIIAGIIIFGILIFLFFTCCGLLEAHSEEGVKAKSTKLMEIVDALIHPIQQEDWHQLDSMRETYELLHQTQGGVKMFIYTTFILIDKPEVLHKVSSFVMEIEKQLHNCQEISQPVLKCLRAKMGSDKTTFNFFDHLENPGKFKLKLAQCENESSTKIMTKIHVKISKSVSSIARVFLFNFDAVNDVLIWVYLYS